MTDATKQFLDDVNDMFLSLDDLGSRAHKAARALADALEHRRIAEISTADPGQIDLADEQWSKLTREARIVAACSREEW